MEDSNLFNNNSEDIFCLYSPTYNTVKEANIVFPTSLLVAAGCTKALNSNSNNLIHSVSAGNDKDKLQSNMELDREKGKKEQYKEIQKPKINVLSLDEQTRYNEQQLKQKKIEKFQKALGNRKNQPEGVIWNETTEKFEKTRDIEIIDKEINDMMSDTSIDLRNFYAKPLSKDISDQIRNNPEKFKEIIIRNNKKVDEQETHNSNLVQDKKNETNHNKKKIDFSESQLFQGSYRRDKSSTRKIERENTRERSRDRSATITPERSVDIKTKRSEFRKDNDDKYKITKDERSKSSIPDRSRTNRCYERENKSKKHKGMNESKYRDDRDSDKSSLRDKTSHKDKSLLRYKNYQRDRTLMSDKSVARNKESYTDKIFSTYPQALKPNNSIQITPSRNPEFILPHFNNYSQPYSHPIYMKNPFNHNYLNNQHFSQVNNSNLYSNQYLSYHNSSKINNISRQNDISDKNPIINKTTLCSTISEVNLATPSKHSKIDLTNEDNCSNITSDNDIDQSKMKRIRDEMKDLVVNLKVDNINYIYNQNSQGTIEEFSKKLLNDLKSISKEGTYTQLLNCIEYASNKMSIKGEKIFTEFISFRDKCLNSNQEVLTVSLFYYIWLYENILRNSDRLKDDNISKEEKEIKGRSRSKTPIRNLIEIDNKHNRDSSQCREGVRQKEKNLNSNYISNNSDIKVIIDKSIPQNTLKSAEESKFIHSPGRENNQNKNSKNQFLQHKRNKSVDEQENTKTEDKDMRNKKRRSEISEINFDKKDNKREVSRSKSASGVQNRNDGKYNNPNQEKFVINEENDNKLLQSSKMSEINKQNIKERIEEKIQNDPTYNLIMKLAHRITDPENQENLKKLLDKKTADLLEKALKGQIKEAVTIDLYETDHFKIWVDISHKDNKYQVNKRIKNFHI